MEVEFQAARRSQQSWLAPLERICLNWLASRLPNWVKPDHLTLLGLVAMLLAGIFYATARYWPLSLMLVNLCLAINWFGDVADTKIVIVRANRAIGVRVRDVDDRRRRRLRIEQREREQAGRLIVQRLSRSDRRETERESADHRATEELLHR